MRRVLKVTAPFIVVLIAWAAASKIEAYGDFTEALIGILPYVTAILALFMSVWYLNSNFFYYIVLMLIFYIFIGISVKHSLMLNEAVNFISILLPVNAVWLCFAKERGIISTYGRNKALLILAQIIWVFINIMGKSGLPLENYENQPAAGLKVFAVVIYILSVTILLGSYMLNRKYINLIFIAVLFTSYISLHFAHNAMVNAIFTSAAFLIMIIGLFDISYSMAFYDTLTEVLSRKALEQRLLKLRSNYSIAMIDIDHFKRINDKYGHDVGDQVLRMVASVISKRSGRGQVFRYGGEEFVVLFHKIPYNEVVQQLHRIRKSIERRPFIIRSPDRPEKKPEKIEKKPLKDQERINVTVSIGIARKNELLKTSYDVIRKADEAMYISKRNGRNCITES
jgi:diguanylate cyclase (GGDEF)-like protein